MDVARTLDDIPPMDLGKVKARIRAAVDEAVKRDPQYLERMLVTEAGEFKPPREVLFDLARSSAADLLRTYTKAREGYATSPFDTAGHKLKFFRKGYTIWSGYPGAGKTTALRQ